MILITGATGLVGRHLVQQLMTMQLPIRCLLREEQARRLPWDEDDPYAPEIVTGSILDDEAIYRAVTGAHTIFHLENALWWGRLRDLERIELSGTRNLITVARSARVGRIIYVSQLGAAPSSAYTLHRIKGYVEDEIRSSGLAYTIIRAGLLFGPDDAFIRHIAMMLRVNPLFFLMPGQGEVVLHPLYIDDLIRALAISLESLDLVDRTLEIGGAEYTTLEDLLLTVMRVAGTRRVIVAVPPYMVRGLARLYSLMLPRSLITPQWLDILATHRTAPLNNTYDYFGFQPRRFEDTLLTYLPQQRHLAGAIRTTFRRRPRSL